MVEAQSGDHAERQLMVVNVHHPFRGFHLKVNGQTVTESAAAIAYGEGGTLEFLFGTLMYAHEMGFRTLLAAEAHKPHHSYAISAFPAPPGVARMVGQRIGWYFLGINWVYHPLKAAASMLIEAVADLFRPEEEPDA